MGRDHSGSSYCMQKYVFRPFKAEIHLKVHLLTAFVVGSTSSNLLSVQICDKSNFWESSMY